MTSMEENLEAHRFDANNRHSQLNLSNDHPGIDIDDDDYINNVMDMDPDGKFKFLLKFLNISDLNKKKFIYLLIKAITWAIT